MYRASDEVDNDEWLGELDRAAERLDLDAEARSFAADLFLSSVSVDNPSPATEERSKRAVLAASLYAGSLIAGEQRSQGAVADAIGVARLTIQQRWKGLLEDAGLQPPNW
jgi:transcription initiation factor TFIIIB Brf1 subunit/transcription initiation factor TFIIB